MYDYDNIDDITEYLVKVLMSKVNMFSSHFHPIFLVGLISFKQGIHVAMINQLMD